jgi:hypothetical protein
MGMKICYWKGEINGKWLTKIRFMSATRQVSNRIEKINKTDSGANTWKGHIKNSQARLHMMEMRIMLLKEGRWRTCVEHGHGRLCNAGAGQRIPHRRTCCIPLRSPATHTPWLFTHFKLSPSMPWPLQLLPFHCCPIASSALQQPVHSQHLLYPIIYLTSCRYIASVLAPIYIISLKWPRCDDKWSNTLKL